MSLLDILFGSNKKPEVIPVPQQVSSQEFPPYRGDINKTEPIEFFGQSKKSTSGEWMISWRDGHYERGNKCNGQYILYNAHQKKVILKGELERPHSGRVANNGCFSIEDWLFTGELNGTFHVYSPDGKELIKKFLNANILNSGISDEGRYAICQTANNPDNNDGNALFAFDIAQGIELFSCHPVTGWAKDYEFIEEEPHFVVVIKELGKFRYDSKGVFIDAEKYEMARLNCDDFVQLLLAAENIIKETSSSQQRIQIALAAILKARSQGADNDNQWKANALKMQGLANELLGNDREALTVFEEAMAINSKIGVKRKVDSLRKKLNDSNK